MNRDPKGYYRLFQVSPDATTEEIKRAYRRLAQKLHPDKSTFANSTRIFQFITEIQNLLIDANSRKRYDPWWTGHFQPIDFRESGRRIAR